MPPEAFGIFAAGATAVVAILYNQAYSGLHLAQTEANLQILRYGSLIRQFILLLTLGMPWGFAAVVYAQLPIVRPHTTSIFGLLVFFVLSILPAFWETFRFALLLKPEGFECQSPWRPKVTARWQEVQKICYDPMFTWFVIHLSNERKVYLSVFVSGIGKFLSECEQLLPATAFQQAKAGYSMLKRPLPTARKTPADSKTHLSRDLVRLPKNTEKTKL